MDGIKRERSICKIECISPLCRSSLSFIGFKQMKVGKKDGYIQLVKEVMQENSN